MKVIYEDNHIIVVYKDENIPSQADSSKDQDIFTMTKEYIKNKYDKPGNVYLGLLHRLDRPVSGLMLMAKTSKAAGRLSKDIAEAKIIKKYYAVVEGNDLKDEDMLVDYLIKGDDQISRVTDEKDGKLAKLKYKKIVSDGKLSLLDIELMTGRHHQIRVQLASRGFPIYGDQRYGKGEKAQIALSAYKLEFIHPVSKKLMCFEHLETTSIINKLLQRK